MIRRIPNAPIDAVLVAVLLLFFSHAAIAGDMPRIAEVRFHGNEVTQPVTMRREMLVGEGDVADPALIERSRQAILDLGLFQSVNVQRGKVDDGVVLHVHVKEKFYLLPIPRVEANTEEEFGLGGQLRWANVWGLNHRLDILGVQRKVAETDRDNETKYSISYRAPFVFNTPYNLGVSLSQSHSLVERGGRSFDEELTNAGLGLSVNLGAGPASQGWAVGGGLRWLGQDTSGDQAPPRYGNATSVSANARYRDVRFKVFSETGRTFGVSYEIAQEGLLSDYEFAQFVTSYSQSWALGDTPHQTTRVIGQFGSYHAGPQVIDAFSIGGSSVMRGYDSNFREGDLLVRIAGEYLRPVVWKWLRLLVVAEVGNAFDEHRDAAFDDLLVSVGIGVRLRVSWFVNLEVELGVAHGLSGGGKTRVFGGGV